MIEMRIQFDGAELARWRQMQRQFPAEMVRANGRAASIVKRKLRAAMKRGGGTADVPMLKPHAEITTLMHGSTPMGGKLADPAVIVSYRLGKAQVVGWPGGLNNWAASWQDKEFRPTTATERHYMHKSLGAQVPSYYVRPERPVIEPLTRSVAPQYMKWFQGAAVKLIEQSLAKQGF